MFVVMKLDDLGRTAHMPVLHERIAADLRSLIHAGTLAAGDRLPTEQDLMAQYGASRTPVRQALQTLANEGLIDTATSRGTFVREQRPLTLYAARYEREHREVSPVDAYQSELLAQGRAAGQTLEMSIVPASEPVASRLRVAEHSLVVQRRCIRTVDTKLSSLQDSYYPYDIADGTEILSPNDVERGIITILAEQGHIEVGYVDEIRPRMPPKDDERRLLQLRPGVPVLDQIRTAYTAQRPVRLTWNVWAGDGIRLVYELGDLQAVHDEPR
jgi:GntR family transcriptional regulator